MKIKDITNQSAEQQFKDLNEAGVGRIVPGVNTTADVGPDEIRIQAAKLGMTVDSNGIPPIAKTNGDVSNQKKKGV
jgi:hypothetical protein